MKYLKVFLLWFLSLLLAFPSLAIGEDTLNKKIVKQLEKVVAESKIQEPSKDILTRSPAGSKLYKNISNGVVLVITEDGMGSGVVVSNKGLIITNWHVVQNKTNVGIVFKQALQHKISEKDIFLAEVLEIDPIRDLALLKIASSPKDLTVIKLGSLTRVEVGQDVFAISHPKGLLWSYTEGVVSQIRQNYNWKYEDGSTHNATIIQTQTVISQGSSGGALFDYNGQVVGILFATREPGLNFAVAVNEVQGFISSALEKH